MMGLKQKLDMRRNDLDKSFRDEVSAFNFVGISERVEELEASSVPNREARLSIMLGCVVDRDRLKLSFVDSELGAASVAQNVVQLRMPMLVQPCNIVNCLTRQQFGPCRGTFQEALERD